MISSILTVFFWAGLVVVGLLVVAGVLCIIYAISVVWTTGALWATDKFYDVSIKKGNPNERA